MNQVNWSIFNLGFNRQYSQLHYLRTVEQLLQVRIEEKIGHGALLNRMISQYDDIRTNTKLCRHHSNH